MIGDKITIEVGCVYEYLELFPELDMLLMDIWDAAEDWYWDKNFRTVREQYDGKLWRWGTPKPSNY